MASLPPAVEQAVLEGIATALQLPDDLAYETELGVALLDGTRATVTVRIWKTK
jgi:hypothetical protein